MCNTKIYTYNTKTFKDRERKREKERKRKREREKGREGGREIIWLQSYKKDTLNYKYIKIHY